MLDTVRFHSMLMHFGFYFILRTCIRILNKYILAVIYLKLVHILEQI